MSFVIRFKFLFYNLFLITGICFICAQHIFYNEKHEQIRVIVENNVELFRNKFKEIDLDNETLNKFNLNNNSDVVRLVIKVVDDLDEIEARRFWLKMNPNFVSDYYETTELPLDSRRGRRPKFVPNIAGFKIMKTTTEFPPEKWAVRNKTFVHNQYREVYQVLYDNNIIVTMGKRKRKSRKLTKSSTTEPEIIPPKYLGSSSEEDYVMDGDMADGNASGSGDAADDEGGPGGGGPGGKGAGGGRPGREPDAARPGGRPKKVLRANPYLQCGPSQTEPCILVRAHTDNEAYDDDNDDDNSEAPTLLAEDVSDTELQAGQQALYRMQKFGYLSRGTSVLPNINYYQGKEYYYSDRKK